MITGFGMSEKTVILVLQFFGVGTGEMPEVCGVQPDSQCTGRFCCVWLWEGLIIIFLVCSLLPWVSFLFSLTFTAKAVL